MGKSITLFLFLFFFISLSLRPQGPQRRPSTISRASCKKREIDDSTVGAFFLFPPPPIEVLLADLFFFEFALLGRIGFDKAVRWSLFCCCWSDSFRWVERGAISTSIQVVLILDILLCILVEPLVWEVVGNLLLQQFFSGGSEF